MKRKMGAPQNGERTTANLLISWKTILFAPMTSSRPASFSVVSSRSRRARRRGASLWLFVLSLPIIFGTCGLVIDLGQIHARRAQAQRAADAAALAGAEISGTDNSAFVITTSLDYAKKNGFSAERGDEVIVTPNFDSNADENSADINTVRVQIKHREPVYFAPVAETLLAFMGWSEGAAQFNRVVGTRAVARKLVSLPMQLGGNYGIATGSQAIANNIINGPYSAYDDADPYSGKYLLDGTPNPDYAKTGGLQKFVIHVSPDFISKSTDKKVYVQIFDPDSVNAPGTRYDGYIRQTPVFPDGVTPPPWALTTTKYQIFKKNADGTVNPEPVAQATYGADGDADQKWVTPDGFAVDTEQWGAGDYEVRVSTLDGNTSNGYALRAGPLEGKDMDDLTWNDTYGDKLGTNPDNIAVPMNADGRMTVGFQTNGTATLKLGYVGPRFAGKTVFVRHYDLDIYATALNYVVDTLPNDTFPGTLPTAVIDGQAPQIPGNGIWRTDSITLPDDFKGGNLAAKYEAGVGALGKDGSAWELFGQGDGAGEVHLIE